MRILEVSIRLAARVQKKNVDIGMRERAIAGRYPPSATSAKFGGPVHFRRDQFLPQAQRDGVHERGAPVDGGAAIALGGKILV